MKRGCVITSVSDLAGEARKVAQVGAVRKITILVNESSDTRKCSTYQSTALTAP